MHRTIIIVVALFAQSAIASPITFEFEGTINSVVHVTANDPFGSAITVGTPFSGRYTFDTATPNTGTNDYRVYVHTVPQFGIDLEIAGLSGDSSSATLPLHYRIITGGLVDNHVAQDIQTQGMSFGGVNAYLAQIYLEGPSTALSSVDLLTTPPVLTDYIVRTFFLGIGPSTNNEPDVIYTGEVTAIRAVPEPPTLLLMLVAASFPAIISSRRRKLSSQNLCIDQKTNSLLTF